MGKLNFTQQEDLKIFLLKFGNTDICQIENHKITSTESIKIHKNLLIGKSEGDIREKYKIGKKLGEGMFSIVKLGTHSLTNELMAIKILEKTKITKIEDKERINREISVMKKINHYNIAKLYSVVETKLIIYLIQEYVQGIELIEYLNKKGKLKETEACKFFHQIISGLEYLHQCGIAHRDFKPENILLTNDNQILKIIDFGLSNTYKKGELLKTACGSPCYVPPEMIKEENYKGALCDIWSAGVILYLMLCGNLPFFDDDNQILYEKILSGQYETPQHLSEDAKDLLSKILEIDPTKRISFEGIKSHPWFSLIDKKYLMHKGINVNEDIMPIDEEILEKMEKLGLTDKMEIRYNIIKNYHNKITTVYNLLLKKKIDNGKKSISDMNSDIYDEYINDKKNKINFYGNIEKVLKNRIGDNKEVLKDVPNWPENKYEENNENTMIGDSGSIMERLIKAGKFTYDEENMCINRVPSIKRRADKKNNNDDSKFKTISSMQTNSSEKFRKTSDIINNTQSPEIHKGKKSKVHFKEENDEIEENNIPMTKSPNPKKSKFKKKEIKDEKKKEKKEEKKEEPKEKNEEEEDWYKEMEELIEKENRRLSQKVPRKKLLKHNKINNKNKKVGFNVKEEESDSDSEENKTKTSLSAKGSKSKLTKDANKKTYSKFGNNKDKNDKKPYTKMKSSKVLNKITDKCKSSKTINTKTAKATKTVKIIKNPEENKKSEKKRENSVGKNEKGNKYKKINVDKGEENNLERRNQSAQRRKLKMNI